MPPYWIRHFEFLNSELGLVISDPQTSQYQISSKSSNLAFWSAVLGPPSLISEFQIRIRNQRPQNSLSTKFHPNLLIFRLPYWIRPYEFPNFEHRSPRTKYHPNQVNFAFSSVTLDPQFRIS